jgi:hypothetical protein
LVRRVLITWHLAPSYSAAADPAKLLASDSSSSSKG